MHRVLAGVVVAVAVVLLSGCAAGAGTPSGGGTDASTPSGGGVAPRDEPSHGPETPIAPAEDQRTCADGEELVLEGETGRIEVAGRCGAVTLRGDSLELQLESAEAVLIEGQSNVVEVDGELGALEIRGDGNRVEAGSLGALVIRGGGNTIEADTGPESQDVSGDGNRIGD